MSAVAVDRPATLDEILGPQWRSLEWRIKSLYWIVDEHGKAVRFEPNDEQLDFIRNLWPRNLILKARQLGFSTLIEILELDQGLFNADHTGVVIADTLPEMDRQARLIASWGANVFVKLPVTNTRGESVVPLLAPLAAAGVQCNVTALFTLEQVRAVSAALGDAVPSFISVFAGRLADAGIDPVPIMREAVAIMRPFPKQRLIWASPREVLNAVQAHDVGCHVITMTNDLIAKLPTLGRDPLQFSLETVKMFHDDARGAGFTL